jgi:hypothetical protein
MGLFFTFFDRVADRWTREEGRMNQWDWWKSLLSQGSPAAPSAERLDGRSKALLHETPGWITNKEAKQLFSPMDDEYAFGEIDEVGKSNIADFAAHVTRRCSFAFMPVEGRVYFSRKADGVGGRS